MSEYYQDKLFVLKKIFGTSSVVLTDNFLFVRGKQYPIVHDVIILLDRGHYTEFIEKELQTEGHLDSDYTYDIANDIQYSFGEEWQNYSNILVEHQQEFSQYFDIVNMEMLTQKCVCDLGCGNGRWSFFLKEICQTLILVDFSDAIFAARKNLENANNCLFFMGDLQNLPFADDFADFLFCLGVLHHLPTPCLNEVRKLKRFAPQLLIFLYYALDNRPIYFQVLLRCVTIIRQGLTKIRNPEFRQIITTIGTYFLYLPLIYLGYSLKPFHLSSYVPLFDFYHDKGIERIKQDVYDRFFTSIEQRVTRKEILQLRDMFSNITISDNLSYWHFICER